MLYKYKDYYPQVGENCYIAPGAAVIGEVKLGKNSSVWFNTVIRGDLALISIGDNTNIQDNSTLHCVKNVPTVVRNNVTVGHGAILHSCSIGDNCLIGMGAIILDGVKVGNNCIIGAGSLVTPKTVIPDGSLVMGSPATVKRTLKQEEIEGISEGVQSYIEKIDDYKDIK